jgi:hypothetical protein
VSAFQPSDSSDSSGDGLRKRLAAYSRYVALVRAQEEAVENGDLERFAELGEAREEIQEELGDTPADGEIEVEAGDPQGKALVEWAMSELRSAMARDERIQRALDDLRREGAESIRTMESRKEHVDTYLAGKDSGVPRPPSRVNRKG